MVRGIWTSHFPSKFRPKFKAFSGTLSGTSFFDFLVHLGAKMLDFGTPLVPSWLQNGAQNRPSSNQRLKKSISLSTQELFLEPICSQTPSKTFLGTILIDFGPICGWFWGRFGVDFDTNITTHFRPRKTAVNSTSSPEITGNRRKWQEIAWTLSKWKS